MKYIALIILSGVFWASCSKAQDNVEPQLIGGPCEGCEAVFEFGEKQLKPIDTLPGFDDKGMKIKISGTVYKSDGKTPAKDVILYVYHTNQEGLYAAKEDAKGWGKRHGYIRGWVKTDANGHYAYHTLKPAAYPNRSEAAHIHYTVLEPDGKYYWLEGSLFQGDSLIKKQEINATNIRGGGTLLLDLKKEGNLMIGTRDIVLGANVPGYK